MNINMVIPEGQRGLLYRDGVLVEVLRPGRHRRRAWRTRFNVELINVRAGLVDPHPRVEALLDRDEVTIVEVPAEHVMLVTRLGKPFAVQGPGRYAMWLAEAGLTVELADVRPYRTAIPRPFWPLAHEYVHEVIVRPYERTLLYVDGEMVEVLAAGRYGLSHFRRTVELVPLDLREQELQIVGQEIMTRDKVTLRLNLVLKHRIVDPVAATEAVDDLRNALYAEVQLAARGLVAGVAVDEMLEGRDSLANAMVERVSPRAKTWGVEVMRLEIKDIVLPGEMKTLLNRVIEAEKHAAAQNILRREEVAATRSLANTARMLENNPVLRRLKEVEAWGAIADKVPNLTVVVAPKDLQAQLRLGDEVEK